MCISLSLYIYIYIYTCLYSYSPPHTARVGASSARVLDIHSKVLEARCDSLHCIVVKSHQTNVCLCTGPFARDILPIVAFAQS